MKSIVHLIPSFKRKKGSMWHEENAAVQLAALAAGRALPTILYNSYANQRMKHQHCWRWRRAAAHGELQRRAEESRWRAGVERRWRSRQRTLLHHHLLLVELYGIRLYMYDVMRRRA